MHQQVSPSLATEVSGYLTSRPSGAEPLHEHDPRWLTVLRDALGHEPMILLARKSGNGTGTIVGYLPLALVRSRLFGRFLVSLPYLNRGGVLADDPDTATQLIDKAIELADQHDVKYLEMRHQQPVGHPGFNAQRDEKVRMVLELPADGEALFQAVGAKVRNQVRKGDKSGLEIQWGTAELLDDFYDVFAVNMRDLGTPVYPRKLFACILESFGGEAELCVVSQGGRAIAGALLVHGQTQTQVPSASSLRAFNHTNANMWMYHRLLLRAIARGAKTFDFGRSTVGSGTYRFKEQWGAVPGATVWQYHLRHGDASAMRPDNPKNARRVELWKKLPVWFTRMVGPAIVRGIP